MDIMGIFIKSGLLSAGFGVGLTIIRDIDPKTLKFVFVASFLCGGLNSAMYEFIPNFIVCSAVSRFLATVFLKTVCIKGKCPVYFPIVITSVYCICPGTALGSMFHHAFSINAARFMTLFGKVVMMCIGICTGVILGDKVLKSDEYKI
ncbi:MAG: hypothetical protein PUB11_00405 [Oscillospiraceae bacterium]|nr:hypothetical protein [Oscillospiraceae bacterium]